MKSPRHNLSNVDRLNKVADCSVCGPSSRIRVRPTKQRCWRKYRQETTARTRRILKVPGNHIQRSAQRQAARRREFIRSLKPTTCAVCGGSGTICWDHSHKTDRFRGWICSNCNIALGLVSDNAETLRRLADYVEAHDKKHPPAGVERGRRKPTYTEIKQALQASQDAL